MGKRTKPSEDYDLTDVLENIKNAHSELKKSKTETPKQEVGSDYDLTDVLEKINKTSANLPEPPKVLNTEKVIPPNTPKQLEEISEEDKVIQDVPVPELTYKQSKQPEILDYKEPINKLDSLKLENITDSSHHTFDVADKEVQDRLNAQPLSTYKVKKDPLDDVINGKHVYTNEDEEALAKFRTVVLPDGKHILPDESKDVHLINQATGKFDPLATQQLNEQKKSQKPQNFKNLKEFQKDLDKIEHLNKKYSQDGVEVSAEDERELQNLINKRNTAVGIHNNLTYGELEDYKLFNAVKRIQKLKGLSDAQKDDQNIDFIFARGLQNALGVATGSEIDYLIPNSEIRNEETNKKIQNVYTEQTQPHSLGGKILQGLVTTAALAPLFAVTFEVGGVGQASSIIGKVGAAIKGAVPTFLPGGISSGIQKTIREYNGLVAQGEQLNVFDKLWLSSKNILGEGFKSLMEPVSEVLLPGINPGKTFLRNVLKKATLGVAFETTTEQITDVTGDLIDGTDSSLLVTLLRDGKISKNAMEQFIIEAAVAAIYGSTVGYADFWGGHLKEMTDPTTYKSLTKYINDNKNVLEKNISEILKNVELTPMSVDEIVRNEMDPNKEQQLTTTQETRKDVREVPGGQIPIQEAETGPVEGLTQETDLVAQRVAEEEAIKQQEISLAEAEKKRIADEEKQKKIDAIHQEKELRRLKEVELGQFRKLENALNKARKDKSLFDESVFNENLFDHPEIAAKLPELQKKITEHNKKITEGNKVSVDNIAARKFNKKAALLNPEQQKQVLDEYNKLRLEKKETFGDLKTVKPEVKVKTKPQAEQKIDRIPEGTKGKKQLVKISNELNEAKTPVDKINAIQKFENNLAEMENDFGLSEDMANLKKEIEQEGFEIPKLEGKKFHTGMKVIVRSSIPDDTLEEGTEIISRVIKPQINKNDKMIQSAEIEVRVGTKPKSEIKISDTVKREPIKITNDAGFLEAEKVNGIVQVKDVQIPDKNNRGKKKGIALYEQLFNEQGKFNSDVVVSEDAKHIYDALKRRGYEVKENPNTLKDGKHYSDDTTKPVFEVTGKKAATTKEVAPPPKKRAERFGQYDELESVQDKVNRIVQVMPTLVRKAFKTSEEYVAYYEKGRDLIIDGWLAKKSREEILKSMGYTDFGIEPENIQQSWNDLQMEYDIDFLEFEKNAKKKDEKPEPEKKKEPEKKPEKKKEEDAPPPEPEVKKTSLEVGKFREYSVEGQGIVGKAAKISMPSGESRTAKYAIVELDEILQSHDPIAFQKTEGYPQDAQGNTVNDRNYQNDKNAQKDVNDKAKVLDPNKLITNAVEPSVGMPIVTKEGIVVSGNGRTMYIKRAAKLHKDVYKKYVDTLKEEAEFYGFKAEDIDEFDNPIIVKVDYDITKYSKAELAKYNKQVGKGEKKIDKIKKLGDMINDPKIKEKFDKIFAELENYETLSKLYNGKISSQKLIRDILLDTEVILPYEASTYFDENGKFTEEGQEIFESGLIGSVFSTKAIDMLYQPGIGDIREKVVLKSIPNLLRNKNLGDYSIIDLFEAAFQVERDFRQSTYTDEEFDQFLEQFTFFEEKPNFDIVVARELLVSGIRNFNSVLSKYNKNADAQINFDPSSALFGDEQTAYTPQEVFDNIIVKNLEERDVKKLETIRKILADDVKPSGEKSQKPRKVQGDIQKKPEESGSKKPTGPAESGKENKPGKPLGPADLAAALEALKKKKSGDGIDGIVKEPLAAGSYWMRDFNAEDDSISNDDMEELKNLVVIGGYIYQEQTKNKVDWKKKVIELVGKIPDNKLENIYNIVKERYGKQIANIEDLEGEGNEAGRESTIPPTMGEGGGNVRPGVVVVNGKDLPEPTAYVSSKQYSSIPDDEQVRGVNLALTRFLTDNGKAFLLADGTGFGKTIQILIIANEFYKRTGEPVLIITENKNIIETRFADDANMLGIDISKFELGTYSGLNSKAAGQKEHYGLAVYDEAQNLKNLTAQKTQAFLRVNSDHKLFTTATPMDRPTGAAYFLSEITDRTPAEVATELGYKLEETFNNKTQEYETHATLLPGHDWDDVIDNIVRLRNDAIKKGALIRREYPFFGTIAYNNLGLDEDFRQAQDESFWYFEARIQRANDRLKKMRLAGERTMGLSRFTEHKKIEVIFKNALKDLKAGKSVVIVAEGVEPTTIKGTGDEVVLNENNKVLYNYRPFNAMLGELNKMFTEAGYPPAKIYGGNKDAKLAAVRKFQAGKFQVALMTPKSGGAGIDLDDQVGNKPRVVYIATINFAGDVYDQILGRFSRKNTKSPAEVKIIVSTDAISDNRRFQTLIRKFRTLRRIQAGEDPDVATGLSGEDENITDVIGGEIMEGRVEYGVQQLLDFPKEKKDESYSEAKSPEPTSRYTHIGMGVDEWVKHIQKKPQKVSKKVTYGGRDYYTLREPATPFGTQRKPVFYSKMQNVLDEKLPSSFLPSQLFGILRSGEIKESEIKWSGIQEWLDSKQGQGKITKAELQDFLKMNELEIVVVEKQEPSNMVSDMYMLRNLEFGDITDIGDFTIEIEKDNQGEKYYKVSKEGIKDVRFDDAEDVIDHIKEKGNTKYQKYVLPGGENYRELLFILPTERSKIAQRRSELAAIDRDRPLTDAEQKEYDKLQNEWIKADEVFTTKHWDERNIFAHIRLDDRIVNGKRILFVEEVQSDWALEGRKKGFKGEPLQYGKKIEGYTPVGYSWKTDVGRPGLKYVVHQLVNDNTGKVVGEGDTKITALKRSGLDPILDMPFKNNWHEFVMKKVLRMAAEQGYDAVGWTTGEQQAERYNLAKYINDIKYVKNSDGTYQYYVTDKNDKEVMQASHASAENVERLLGKSILEKMDADAGEKTGGGFGRQRILSGLDLKIGGEWAVSLYDKVLPNFLNKYAKKWDAKVEGTDLNTESPLSAELTTGRNWIIRQDGKEVGTVYKNELKTGTYAEAIEKAKENFFTDEESKTEKIHSIPVTSKMANSVLYEGQSMFEGQSTFGRDESTAPLIKLRDYKRHLELSILEFETILKDPVKEQSYWERENESVYFKMNAAKKELKKVNDKITELAKAERKKISLKGQQDMFAPETPKEEVPEKEETVKVEVKKKPSDDQLALFEQKRSYADMLRKFNNEQYETRTRILYTLEKAIVYSPEFQDGVSIPIRTVPKDWKRTGFVNFAGRKLSKDNTATDIADLFYIFRDPKVETFHFIGLDKDNNIVGNACITCDASNYVSILGDDVQPIVEQLVKQGATQLTMLHNHPAGNPEPSQEDVDSGANVRKYLEGIIDLNLSIVINGGRFSSWAVTDEKYVDINYKPFKNPAMHPNQKFYDWFDTYLDRPKLADPEMTAMLFSQLKHGNGNVALVVADNQLNLRGYEYMPASVLDDNEALSKKIDEVLKDLGGSQVFIVGSSRDIRVNRDEVTELASGFYEAKNAKELTTPYAFKSYVATVIYNNKEGNQEQAISVIQYKNQEVFSKTRPVFREDTKSYGTKNDANFKKWFGDSKVVDEKGKPLVVYHGTGAENIISFKPQKERRGSHQVEGAYFFTNDPSIAEGYAGNNPRGFDKSGRGIGDNILPVYLSFQNPKIINGIDKVTNTSVALYSLVDDNRIIEFANQGYDGIIAKDVIDAPNAKGLKPQTVYIAFSSNQIKSVFNEGTFDKDNPSILKEGRTEYRPNINKAVYPGVQPMVGGGNMGVPEQHKPIVKSQFTSSDLNNPIRLRNIGKSLSSIIGYELSQEMRTGLVKRFARRARGIYFPQSGIIRLNNIADINALTHEVGHKFDREVFQASDGIAFDGTPEAGVIVRSAGRKDPVLRARLLDQARIKYGNAYVDSVLEKYELRKELIAMLEKEGYPVKSYPPSQIIPEGVAEFTRNYIMKPNFPTTIAPKFTILFENLMSSNDVFNRFIRSAQEQWKNYNEQDPRVITESTIHRETKEDDFLGSIAEFAGRSYMNIIDGLEPFRALQRRFKDETNAVVTGENDPLLQVLSLLGEDGKAEQFLYYQPFKRKPNDVELLKDVKPLFEILEPILKSGHIKEYEGYLVALRNIELYENEIGAAATTTEKIARETVDLYEQQFGKANMEQFQKDIWAYQKALLDYYYAAGKLTAEAYTKSLELHKYYVPFKRFFGEHESTGQTPQVSKYVKDFSPSPVKKIKGSVREVVTPLGSIIENTYDLLAAADRNIALKNIIESMQAIDPRLVQEIPKTSITGKMGVDGEVKWVWDNKKPENEHIVSVFENGKVKYYQIPKEYYDAFFAINGNYDKAIRILSVPSRILQAGAVQFDPTFAVRNVPRDQMSALFYSKYGYNPFHFVKGIAAYAKKDDMYQKFLASGADQSFLTAMDQQLSQNYIDKKLGKTFGTRAQEYTRNPLKVFQDINRVSELGTRLGAFRKAFLKTGDIYLAMQEGRDIAADYGIKGLAMKNVSPLYPFLNARIQHMRMTTSAIKNNPLGSLAKGFMYVTAPAILNWIANNLDDDDRKLYEQLPYWRKIAFFNIRVPFTNSYLPIPKGFWGVLFGSTAEYALDKIYEKDKGDVTDLLVALKNEYVPIGANIADVFPQFLRPVAEQWANEIAFTGAPIVPASYEGLPAELQYNDYTSHVAVVLGGITSISPMRIDAFIRGTSAGFGTYPIAVTDELLEAVGIAEDDPSERFKVLGINLQKMPLIKAFIPVEPSGTKSESVGEFYDKLDDLEKMNKTVNKLISTGNEEKLLNMFVDEESKADYKFYLENQTTINKFKTILRVARELKIVSMKESSGKDNMANVDKVNYMVVKTAEEFQKAYKNKTEFEIDDFLMDLYSDFQDKKKVDKEAKEDLKEELGIEKKKNPREVQRGGSMRELDRSVER